MLIKAKSDIKEKNKKHQKLLRIKWHTHHVVAFQKRKVKLQTKNIKWGNYILKNQSDYWNEGVFFSFFSSFSTPLHMQYSFLFCQFHANAEMGPCTPLSKAMGQKWVWYRGTEHTECFLPLLLYYYYFSANTLELFSDWLSFAVRAAMKSCMYKTELSVQETEWTNLNLDQL